MFDISLLHTVLYTYTGTLVLCALVAIAIVYSLRDILGGVVVAACVCYLYNM